MRTVDYANAEEYSRDCPGDQRGQALIEAAFALASRSGARLVVVSVLSAMPCEFQRMSLVMGPLDLWALAVQERAQYLNTLVVGRSVPNGDGEADPV